MNYTHPDSDEDDTPEDWLISSLFFVRALSMLLKEGEGIVVCPQNDLASLVPGKTYIIFNEGKQVHCVQTDEDLEEGQMVWMDRDE